MEGQHTFSRSLLEENSLVRRKTYYEQEAREWIFKIFGKFIQPGLHFLKPGKDFISQQQQQDIPLQGGQFLHSFVLQTHF